MAGALAVRGFMRSMFVDVAPTDPLTLAGVIATLVLVSLAASVIPARRASAVDPVRALRAE